jgi:membrane protein required for colicin V production
VAIILGFKCLGFGMNFLAPHIGEQLSQRFLPYMAFSFIFFPIIFLLNRFGWQLRKAVRYTIFGTFDGMAGAFIGIFTWVFGISTFIWLLGSIDIHFPKETIKGSVLFPYVVQVAPTVISKVSDWIPAGGNLIKSLT